MKRMPERGQADALRVRRALVESFAEDASPRGAKAAALAALGLAATAATVSTASASGGLSGAAKSSGAALASAIPKAGALVALKWFGAGLLGGAAVLAPAQLIPRSSSPTAERAKPVDHSGELMPAQPSPARETIDVRATAEPLVERRELERVVPREPTRTAEGSGRIAALALDATPKSAANDVASKAESGAPATALDPSDPPKRPATLGEEIARLDAARRAMASGDARVALSLLDRHAVDFPNGSLGPEAVVLRLEALIKADRRAEAARLAAQLAEKLPDRYADKIRALLAESSSSK